MLCIYVPKCVWAVFWPALPCVEVMAHIRVSSSVIPILLFETGSLAEQGACYFSYTGWPVSLQDLPVSTFPLTNAAEWGVCPSQHFYPDSRDRNSGSHACVASPSLT